MQNSLFICSSAYTVVLSVNIHCQICRPITTTKRLFVLGPITRSPCSTSASSYLGLPFRRRGSESVNLGQTNSRLTTDFLTWLLLFVSRTWNGKISLSGETERRSNSNTAKDFKSNIEDMLKNAEAQKWFEWLNSTKLNKKLKSLRTIPCVRANEQIARRTPAKYIGKYSWSPFKHLGLDWVATGKHLSRCRRVFFIRLKLNAKFDINPLTVCATAFI